MAALTRMMSTAAVTDASSTLAALLARRLQLRVDTPSTVFVGGPRATALPATGMASHPFGLPPWVWGRTCMEHSMHSWLRHARAPAQHEHKHTCAAVTGTQQPLLWHAATRGWCACRRLSWFHGPVRMPALCLVQAARDRATCSEGSYEVAPTSSQFAHSAVLGPSRRLRGLFGRLLPRHSLGRRLCSCWGGWDRDGGGF